jgi:hypothetical protein
MNNRGFDGEVCGRGELAIAVRACKKNLVGEESWTRGAARHTFCGDTEIIKLKYAVAVTPLSTYPSPTRRVKGANPTSRSHGALRPTLRRG